MPEPVRNPTPDALFAERKPESTFPRTAVGIAVAALVILGLVLVLLGRRPGSGGENAAYAQNLRLGSLQMSESESLSGGKSTYVDGRLTNAGPLTVTGATVRVTFPDDSGTPPQVMTVPVQLIREREPYVDVQMLSAAPLAPGAAADFRLIFEGVSEAWNHQPPAIEVTGVSTK